MFFDDNKLRRLLIEAKSWNMQMSLRLVILHVFGK